ncbi:hypothetical protein GYMLUDRAFT_61896 [Collybiopsis luxurians FD-317 M1]|uniref:Uncharacterized protein n=1 Tax=Collybiopsis luxurians FD-317 M1 TaxID=944289 RepID=A0A0D0C2V3_9AGAR|nr:hypothetical protein GYMLUDRAFT_61896 [Collybiopsis luxurians FD-317 M1]
MGLKWATPEQYTFLNERFPGFRAAQLSPGQKGVQDFLLETQAKWFSRWPMEGADSTDPEIQQHASSKMEKAKMRIHNWFYNHDRPSKTSNMRIKVSDEGKGHRVYQAIEIFEERFAKEAIKTELDAKTKGCSDRSKRMTFRNQIQARLWEEASDEVKAEVLQRHANQKDTAENHTSENKDKDKEKYVPLTGKEREKFLKALPTTVCDFTTRMSVLGGLCFSSLVAARDPALDENIRVWGFESQGQNSTEATFAKSYPGYGTGVVAPFVEYADKTLVLSSFGGRELFRNSSSLFSGCERARRQSFIYSLKAELYLESGENNSSENRPFSSLAAHIHHQPVECVTENNVHNQSEERVADLVPAEPQGDVADPVPAELQGDVTDPVPAESQGDVADPVLAELQGDVANPVPAEPQGDVGDPVPAEPQGEGISMLTQGAREQDVPPNAEGIAEVARPLMQQAQSFMSSGSVQAIDEPAINPAPCPSQGLCGPSQAATSFTSSFDISDFYVDVDPQELKTWQYALQCQDDVDFDYSQFRESHDYSVPGLETSQLDTSTYLANVLGTVSQSGYDIDMSFFNPDSSHTRGGFYDSNDSSNSVSNALLSDTINSSSASNFGGNYSSTDTGNLWPDKFDASSFGGVGSSGDQSEFSYFSNPAPCEKQPHFHDQLDPGSLNSVIPNTSGGSQVSVNHARPFNPAEDASTTLPAHFAPGGTYSAIHDPALLNSGINSKTSNAGEESSGKQKKKAPRKRLDTEGGTSSKKARMSPATEDSSSEPCGAITVSPFAQLTTGSATVSTRSGCVIKPSARMQGL